MLLCARLEVVLPASDQANTSCSCFSESLGNTCSNARSASCDDDYFSVNYVLGPCWGDGGVRGVVVDFGEGAVGGWFEIRGRHFELGMILRQTLGILEGW